MLTVMISVMGSLVPAYIGPGAGLGLGGAVLALLAAVGTALMFIVLWPIRLMLRGREEEDADLADAEGGTELQSESVSDSNV